ncbi:MAG: asparaginase [Sphaerisporangium sp.]|nr:asparaginase [Sphaerisporangium sp.]
MDSNGKRPQVAVFSLGGTISSVASNESGAVPTLTADELVAQVPNLDRVAAVVTRPRARIASSNLQLGDIVALHRAVRAELDSGSTQGVVVLQGTDTLEESAFALDLLHGGNHPIVISGAMRHANAVGADGPANISAAIRVAASEAATGLGAVVVLNDEIHAARFVRKTHTTSPATFASAPLGPIGWVTEGRVRVPLRPTRQPAIELPEKAVIPPVALLKLGIGDDGRLLRHVLDAGFAGLVIESLGGGHVPSPMVPFLARIAQEIPVVLSSRCLAGEVLRETYGYPGSEIDLLQRGLVNAGALDGSKARVLLSLLLAAGRESSIAADFDSFPS